MSEDTTPTAFDGSTSASSLADMPEPPTIKPVLPASAAYEVTGFGGAYSLIDHVDWRDFSVGLGGAASGYATSYYLPLARTESWSSTRLGTSHPYGGAMYEFPKTYQTLHTISSFADRTLRVAGYFGTAYSAYQIVTAPHEQRGAAILSFGIGFASGFGGVVGLLAGTALNAYIASPSGAYIRDWANSSYTRLFDPVVIDLDGDGIELAAAPNVFFDYAADGTLLNGGWVGRDDGILVMDLDGNGLIGGMAEVPSENFALGGDSGEGALNLLDANHDGKIDASDAAYQSLKVWRDLDQDAQVDAGELSDLGELGILSINTAFTARGITDPSGNRIESAGSASTAGGALAMGEVSFGAAEGVFREVSAVNGVRVLEAEDGSRWAVAQNDAATFIDLDTLGASRGIGREGNDTLAAASGGARLSGGGGSDLLLGRAGDDVLEGGDGSDTLSGGAGTDTLLADADDVVDGGDGADVLIFQGDRAVTLDMTTAKVERVVSRGGADHLTSAADDSSARFVFSGDGDDVLTLGGGDDFVSAEAGNDTVDAGGGNDVIIAGAGSDLVDGGDGADMAMFDGNSDQFQIIRDGEFTIVTDLGLSDGISDGVTRLRNVEVLRFNDRSVRLTGANTGPEAVDDLVERVFEASFTIPVNDLLVNDYDDDFDVLRINSLGVPNAGAVRLDEAGNVVVEVPPGFQGDLRFDYTVADGNGGFDRATATIRVTPPPPGDPLRRYQWHLDALEIAPVWKDYTGEGVKIGILDEGVEYTHADLAANYDQSLDWDFADGDGSPLPTGATENHGTFVAGIIAAANNGVGVVGVAYDATIASLRRSFGSGVSSTQTVNAFNKFVDFDVVNNSWGPSTRYDSTDVASQAALERAVREGRHGLGTAVVFSGGNDRAKGGNANDGAYVNSRHTVTVAATYVEGKVTAFSNPGAALLVTAPGQDIISTDRTGTAGYQHEAAGPVGLDYTGGQGTSYSAPVVSGIIALMLEANPNLGYRDIMDILANSAGQNDASGSSWQWNGSGTWNGGGMHFSHDHGFGMVNARAAVRLAETWLLDGHAAKVSINERTTSATRAPGLAIADTATVADTLTIAQDLTVNQVEVDLNLNHTNIGDLIVTLVAPDGTRSVLVNRPGKTPDDAASRGDTSDGIVWKFTSMAHWGGAAAGQWRLEVTDAAGGHVGVLNSWKLSLYGDAASADDTYVYTDEFARLAEADSARATLSDGTGVDTLNFSAMSGDAMVDIGQGQTSLLGDTEFKIAEGTVIENAITGEGDDIVIGNAANNSLFTGRGADLLVGGAGTDLLDGGEGADTVSFAGATQGVTLSLETGGTGGEATGDIYRNIENVEGSGFADWIAGNGGDNMLVGGQGDDVLDGGAGRDTLAGSTGNDTLLGGAGFDVAVYDGMGDEYEVIIDEVSGVTTVHDLRASNGSSVDTLYGVERLQFRDRVTPISNNSAPTAGADTAATLEDTSVAIRLQDLIANDGDLDGDAIRIIGIGGAVGGSVGLSAAGTVVFTPAKDFNGEASFTYTISDDQGGETTQTVTIDVAAVNDAPEAGAMRVGLPEGHSVAGTLVAHDAEQGGEGLTYVLESGPAHGQVSVQADGSFVFTALEGGPASESFTYRVTDSQGLSSVATVTVDMAGRVRHDAFQADDGRSVPAESAEKVAPVTAALTDGTFVVVWAATEGAAADGLGVMVQRFDAGGNPLGQAVRANTWTLSDQHQPTVTPLADGGYVVGWTSEDQDGGAPGLSGAYARRFDGEGKPVSGEILLNQETLSVQARPSIAGLPGGGFVATWESYAEDGDLYGVYGARFDVQGNRVGNAFQVNTHTSGQQYDSAVTTLADGGFVVIWTSYGQDGGAHGVFAQKFDSVGRKIGPERQVNQFSPYSQHRPAVAALPDGGYVVVFEDGGGQPAPASSFDISARIVDADGAPAGAQIRINAGDWMGSQQAPSVAVLPGGGFAVVWQSDTVIRAQRFDSQGIAEGGVIDLGTAPTGSTALPSLAVLVDGSLAAVWQAASVTAGAAPVTVRVLAADASGEFASIVWRGNDSADIFAGAEGADRLEGRGGNDSLYGEAGDDLLVGGKGADHLDGGTGADVASYVESDAGVVIDLAAHTASGGDAQGDVLSGIENLTGSRFADRLTGDNADNVLEGGAGGDSLVGGLGADTASYAGSGAAVKVNMAEGTASGGHAQGDVLQGMENLTGSSFADQLIGDAGANVIEGGAGADTLGGGAGSDTLSYAGSNLAVTVDLGSGAASGGDAQGDTFSGFENLRGSEFSDRLTGDATDNSVSGGGGDDSLLGGGGNDVLDGGAGRDTVSYDGSFANYKVERVAEGYRITDLRSDVDGDTGSDTLANVEELRFADFSFHTDGTNNQPILAGDSFGTDEDVPLHLSASQLLGNDVDVDGDPLTITKVGGAVGGTVTLGAGGQVTFTPFANYNGEASFTYTASDGHSGVRTATATVAVGAVNDDPSVGGKTVQMWEDQAATIPLSFLMGGADDVDGDTVTFAGLGEAVGGTVTTDAGGNVVFTPAADYNGPASFSYSVSDGQGGLTTRVVQMDVRPVNDLPVARTDYFSTTEDTPLLLDAAQLLTNDSDVDGDSLSITAVGNAVGGVVGRDAQGRVVFTPNPDFVGDARFSYVVEDGKGGSALATARISVGGANDAPIPAGKTVIMYEDQPFRIPVSFLLENAVDPDGDAISVSAVGGAVNGSVNLDEDGFVTFSPAPDYNGDATFTYTLSDGKGGLTTASVSVRVNAVDDAPRAGTDQASTTEDQAVTLSLASLLSNDLEPDGEAVEFVSLRDSLGGRATLDGSGNVVFTPDRDFNGQARFSYIVQDPDGTRSLGTVLVNVTPVNDAAKAYDGYVRTASGMALSDRVRAEDPDDAPETLAYGLAAGTKNGTLSFNADGSYTYTPNAGFLGTDSFTYKVTDPHGAGTTATVTIDVGGDGPVRVNTTTRPLETGSELLVAPSVAMRSQGGWAVVWGRNSASNLSATSEVAARFYNADGSPRSGEMTVNSFTADDQVHPDVAALKDGTYLASWSSRMSVDTGGFGTYSTLVIRAQRLDAAGNRVGSEFNLTDSTYVVNQGGYRLSSRQLPQVRALSDGGFMAVWHRQLGGLNDTDLFARRFDSSGNPVSAEFQVHATSATHQQFPQVCELTGGRVAFVWQEGGTGTIAYQDVRARIFNANGTAVGNEFTVHQATDYSQLDPVVVATPDGGFTVAWTDGNSSPSPSSPWDVSARHFNLDGVPAANAWRVNLQDLYGYQTQPNLALMENGGLVAVWSSDDLAGHRKVVAQRLDASGNVIGSAFVVADLTSATAALPEVAVLPGGKDFVVVWQGDAQGGTQVFSQVFRPLLEGTAAADHLVGTNMEETLLGSAGNDVLDGRGGNDTLVGGAGADRMVGGDGYDVADYSGSATGVTIDLGTGLGLGGDADGDQLSQIELVIGSGQADTLLGGTGDDRLLGGAGNDVLGGGQGYDVLDGGAGTDTALLTGSPGEYRFFWIGSTLRGVGPDGVIDLIGIERIEFTEGGAFEVSGRNVLPVAGDDAAATVEDTVLVLPLSALVANDFDLDGALTLVSVGGATGGSVTKDASGNVVFTPTPDFHGEASFTYTVADASGVQRTATVTVAVNSVNDLPQVTGESTTTAEDTALVFDPAQLLANDSDADGGTLTIVSVGGATHGSVSLDGQGRPVFTPAPNYVGEAGFDYTVSDGQGGSRTAHVAVQVTERNQAPTLGTDHVAAVEDQQVVIDVSALLANDGDADGDALSLVEVGGAVGGSVALLPDGHVVFTPSLNHNGNASFTYTVRDARGALSTATVAVSVQAVNDAPVAADDALTVAEDSVLSFAASFLVDNDADVDAGDSLNVTSVSGAVGGSVSLDANNVVTFVPNPDFHGEASFTYVVRDASGATAVAVARVQVTPRNDAPVAMGDTFTATEDHAIVLSAASLLANDRDVDGDALSIVSVDQAVGGTVSLGADGLVVFTPSANVNGEASFRYVVKDASGATSSAVAHIQVAPVNDAPIAVADLLATLEDQPLLIQPAQLLGNDTDVDGDALAIVSVGNAVGGTVALDASGKVVFTPAADFHGAARFSYTVRDPSGALSTAIATVQVTEVNDTPEAGNDAVAGQEDRTLLIPIASLLLNDSDRDGDTRSIVSAGDAIGGEVSLDNAGNIVFIPDPDFSGQGSFVYHLSDERGGTTTATVVVDLAAVNDAPQPGGDLFNVAEDDELVLNADDLLVNDRDRDMGDRLTLAGVDGAIGGLVRLDAQGRVVFTPFADFNGDASFRYRVRDQGGLEASATSQVTVVSVNDAPVAANSSHELGEDDDTRIFAFPASDVDAGDSLTFTVLTQPALGMVVNRGDGTFAFTPGDAFQSLALGQSREATFTWQARDAAGAVSAIRTATLTVQGDNDAPIATDVAYNALEDEGANTFAFAATDVDQGAVLTFAILTQPARGVVVNNGDGTFSFSPAGHFDGLPEGQSEQVSFTWTAVDEHGTSSVVRTATMTVTGTNHVPVIDGPVLRLTHEDAPSFTADLLAGASDVDASDVLSATDLVQTGGRAAVFSQSGNAVSLDPAQFTDLAVGESLTLSFGFNVFDGTVKVPQTLTVTVEGRNDAPLLAAALSDATDEDAAPFTADLLAGASDVDASDVLSAVDLVQVSGRPVSFTQIGGSFSLNPAQFDDLAMGESVTLTFGYNILDGTAKVPQTLTITVEGRNDAPVIAAAVSGATHEDAAPLTADLLAGASDVDATDVLSATDLVQTGGRAAVFSQSGNVLVLDPAQFTDLAVGESLSLEFCFNIFDGTAKVAQTLTVTIEGGNDAPVLAAALSATTHEDAAPFATDLLAGASDVDVSDVLSAVDLVQTGGRAAVFQQVGDQLVLDPVQFDDLAVGESVTLEFSFNVFDGSAKVAQTLTVTVEGRNDAPVIAAALAGATHEDVAPFTADLLAGASDVDATDVLSATNLVQVSGRPAAFIQSGNVLVIDPAQFTDLAVGESITLTFGYNVSDGTAKVPQTLTITVEGRNDSPVIAAALSGATDEDAPPFTADLLAGASDVDATDVLSATDLVQVSGRTAVFSQSGSTLVLDPAQFTDLGIGESLTLEFSFNVSDGTAKVSQALTVTVEGSNDAPVLAAALSGVTHEDAPFTADLLAGATDVDASDVLSATDLVQVGGRAVVFAQSGNSISLDPAQFNDLAFGESVTLSFAYYVFDGTAKVTQTLTLTVEGRNDAPVLVSALTGAAEEDAAPFTADLVAGASDVDASDVQSATDLAQVGGRAAVFSQSGNAISLNPAQFNDLAVGELVTLTFSYNVFDGTAKVAQRLTLTVEGRNDAPVLASALVGITHEDAALFTADLLAGASDVDASNVLSATDLEQTGGRAAVLSQSGNSITLDPAQFNDLAVGESVTLSFAYNVFDGTAKVAQTLTLTVEGRNDAPVLASALVGATDEDAAVFTADLLAGASDVDASDVLSATDLEQTGGRAVVFSQSRNSISLDPAQFNDLAVGESVTLVFGYSVFDGTVKVAQSLTLTVEGRNDAPVLASVLVGATDEDAAIFTADLLAGASDMDTSDVLSATDLEQTGGRAAVFSQSGNSISLDPAQFNDLAVGESVTLVFGYSVFDGTAKVAQTLTLTVEGRNDAPVLASALVDVTHEDAATFTADLLAGATDVDASDVLSATDLEQTGGRAAVFVQSGNSISLDPAQFNDLAVGESVTLSFAYNVWDGTATVAQTLTLTVEGRNDAPVLASALVDVTHEDAATFTADLLAGATDVDASDVLSATDLVQTGGRAAVFSQSGNSISLDPAQFTDLAVGESVTLSFAYNVWDGTAKVAQSLTLTVEGRNDAPVLASVLVDVTDEDATTFTADLLAGATDVDASDVLSATDLVQTGGRAAVFSQSGNTISLDPAQFTDLAVGEGVTLSFDYSVFDGTAKVAQTLTLTVEGRNDAPVLASALVAATDEDAAPFTADLLAGASDVDASDVLSATDLVQVGGRAAVFVQSGNSISLDPAQFNDLAVGESVTLSFAYNVFDGHVTVLQTLTLTVEGRNDGPVAVDVAFGLGEDDWGATFAFVAADVDHGAQLAYMILTQPAEGVVANNGDGTFSFSPNGDFEDLALGETRQVSFQWKATDDHGTDSEVRTAAITVTGTNDGPVAIADSVQAEESTAIVITAADLLGNDWDVDNGAGLSLLEVDSAVNGSVGRDASGNVVFTPAFGFSGLASFDYVVTDEHGATARTTVTVEVSAVDNGLIASAAAQLHDGGAGVDTLSYAGSTAGVTVNLFTGTGSGGWAEGDSYARLENVIGSSFNDTLVGNSADNLFEGGAGADILIGGLGNDTVSYLGSTGMVVVDLGKGFANKSDAKKDTLTEIENVTGSAYADKLTGDAGTNTLAGGGGADLLEGGAGADTYVFDRGDSVDTVVNTGRTADGDKLVFGEGISFDQLWFSQNKFDLELSVVGTADKVVVANWFKSTSNHVASFETADGHTLAHGQVQNLVSAMATLTPPPVGQTSLTAQQHQQLDGVIAANWQSH